MNERIIKISSSSDGLELDARLFIPESEIKAVVMFAHGMAEHKERYFDFINFLNEHGYACLIHDHRGHGQSVKDKKDLGYFGDESSDFIVEDLHDVYLYITENFVGKPVYLFSHSMGTLVSRKYLKQYDDTLEKLVICGAPCDNPGKAFGLQVVKLIKAIKGDHHRSKLINKIIFGSYDGHFEGQLENRWLSANQANVQAYNEDPLDGFIFTTNGFMNLFNLMIDVFNPDGWAMKNKQLPILFIAGADDPVIGSLKQWQASKDYLIARGYSNIKAISYPGLRHEILNETNHDVVYRDVLNFFETK